MISQQEYKYITTHPQEWESFVKQIDLEYTAPFIESVSYEHMFVPTDVIDRCLECTAHFLTKWFLMKGKKSKIYVARPAFFLSNHPTINDFLSSLIDHEGYHAKEIYEQPEIMLGEPQIIRLFKNEELESDAHIMAEREIRAIRNQLSRAGERNISEEFSKKLEESLNFYYDLLTSKEKLLEWVEWRNSRILNLERELKNS